ncbi:DUF1904 family protein [Spiroplasma sp. DGKH1]|uniref:DUF1904 family protein n=1 Tax=Spiroplasma sp. DGKH1 TaxID=3050074 RepID=UPI0034C6836F
MPIITIKGAKPEWTIEFERDMVNKIAELANCDVSRVSVWHDTSLWVTANENEDQTPPKIIVTVEWKSRKGIQNEVAELIYQYFKIRTHQQIDVIFREIDNFYYVNGERR